MDTWLKILKDLRPHGIPSESRSKYATERAYPYELLTRVADLKEATDRLIPGGSMVVPAQDDLLKRVADLKKATRRLQLNERLRPPPTKPKKKVGPPTKPKKKVGPPTKPKKKAGPPTKPKKKTK